MVLLAGSMALAQAPTSRGHALRTELDSLEARYRRASEASARLSRQADSLAAQIQEHKSKKPRTLLSDRSLAEELRRSQELANQLQAARQVEAGRLDSLVRKAEQTLKILNEEVTNLTIRLSAAKARGDKAQQKDVTAALQETYGLRQRCQVLLQGVPAPAPLIEVRVDPLDSPEALAEKADFLLDQADRLRRNASQATEKSEELRQEAVVRERLSDFVQDLRVFDPTAETPRAASAAGMVEAGAPAKDTQTRSQFEEGIVNLSPAVLAEQNSWPAATAQLSDSELRSWIARLEHRRQRWVAQADSLTERALKIKRLISSQPDQH